MALIHAPLTESRRASLWPTVVGLTFLLLGGLYVTRSTESSMAQATIALASMLVTLGGSLGHGGLALWRRLKGDRGLAKSSLRRAGLYAVFGIASLAIARQQGNAVNEFHEGLTPRTSLHEALRRLDVLYAGHPSRWRFISAWGTNDPLTLADYGRVGQSQEAAAFVQWSGPEGRTSSAGADPAEALARTRQVWFTFRTDVGFVHFFVTLDERGVITAVSEIVGHQA